MEHLHGVLSSGQSLAASGHPHAQRIVEQCRKLEGHWAELEQAYDARAHCLQQAVTVQQVGDKEGGVCRAVEAGPAVGGRDCGTFMVGALCQVSWFQ